MIASTSLGAFSTGGTNPNVPSARAGAASAPTGTTSATTVAQRVPSATSLAGASQDRPLRRGSLLDISV